MFTVIEGAFLLGIILFGMGAFFAIMAILTILGNKFGNRRD